MTIPPPGDRSHLERLINTWAKELQTGTATAGRLRYYIAFCVIATTLGQSTTEPDPLVVIKGGAALQLRFGLYARASKDLDATTQHDLAETVAIVADRLREGWQGFTATLTDPVPISGARTAAPPLRCTIKLAYKAKPFVSIPFELALAEPGVLTGVEALAPAQPLDPVRLTASESIPVMGVHHQIAQKLHACTETPLEGENTRVRDLYDIILINPLAHANGLHHTRRACVDIFDHRNQQPWPPTIAPWPSWPVLWDGIDPTPTISLQDALALVNRLVADIESSMTT